MYKFKDPKMQVQPPSGILTSAFQPILNAPFKSTIFDNKPDKIAPQWKPEASRDGVK